MLIQSINPIPFVNIQEQEVKPNAKFVKIVHQVMAMFSKDSKTGRILKEGKLMSEKKWIEFYDPLHRDSSILRKPFNQWKENPKLQSSMSFFQYLEQQLKNDQQSLLHDTKNQLAYLKPSERSEYKIRIQKDCKDDIVFYNAHGNILEDGEYMTVLGPDNEIYAAKEQKGKIHHSSFFGGMSVIFAGSFIIEKGVLSVITGHSGHYKPNDLETERFLKHLKDLGLNLSKVRIIFPSRLALKS